MSANVGDALLGFCLGSGLGLRRKREDSCPLPFTEPRQQHDLAIGELKRSPIFFGGPNGSAFFAGTVPCWIR
jgi:hypothetical protein